MCKLPDPEVIKLINFKPLTQLSMKFQLLLKTKILKNKDVPFLDFVFIMLISVEMATIVGTFMSMINSMLS